MKTKEVLNNLMKFPHRGSSTSEEREAAKYLKSEYSKIGLEVKLDEFETIKRAGVFEFGVPAFVLTISFIFFYLIRKYLH